MMIYGDLYRGHGLQIRASGDQFSSFVEALTENGIRRGVEAIWAR